jgi:hypothetical protein
MRSTTQSFSELKFAFRPERHGSRSPRDGPKYPAASEKYTAYESHNPTAKPRVDRRQVNVNGTTPIASPEKICHPMASGSVIGWGLDPQRS